MHNQTNYERIVFLSVYNDLFRAYEIATMGPQMDLIKLSLFSTALVMRLGFIYELQKAESDTPQHVSHDAFTWAVCKYGNLT